LALRDLQFNETLHQFYVFFCLAYETQIKSLLFSSEFVFTIAKAVISSTYSRRAMHTSVAVDSSPLCDIKLVSLQDGNMYKM